MAFADKRGGVSESAYGPKRTRRSVSGAAAFGGKAGTRLARCRGT